MPFLQYNGLKLHYIDINNQSNVADSNPLLFIHGAGSAHICWALQIKEFSKNHRIIAPDLSGHGESERAAGPASIDNGFAHEIDALVNHLNLHDFIMIGHSMGGGVAMSYVLHNYEVNPKALVLVDTSPDLELSKLALGLVKETVDDRIFMLKCGHYEEYTDACKIKKYEDEVRVHHPEIMERDLAACNKFDIRERVSEVDIPTFVLVGEHDDIIPPKVALELEKRLPHSDIAIVRNAYHSPMIEEPAEFNRLLQKFILWVGKNA